MGLKKRIFGLYIAPKRDIHDSSLKTDLKKNDLLPYTENVTLISSLRKLSFDNN